ESDPENFLQDQKWHYGRKTGNGALCNHIHNHHLSLYLDETEKNGWAVLINPICNALTNGHMIVTLHEALQKPGVTLKKLPPVPGHRSTNLPSHMSLEAGLPLFTISTLHQYLIKFIVANDQVCISILTFCHAMAK
ncbi:hypothetical protein SCLCIDRAFT_140556, partial [Scleroderma citrinum Foug A]